jgi:hypothetical protein
MFWPSRLTLRLLSVMSARPAPPRRNLSFHCCSSRSLHRDADPAGEAGRADYLGAGHDTDDLLAVLASAPEYFQLAHSQPR